MIFLIVFSLFMNQTYFLTQRKVINFLDLFLHLIYDRFFLRSLFLSSLQKMLFAHFFNKTVNNYVISYVTSYLIKQVKYPPHSKLLVVN